MLWHRSDFELPVEMQSALARALREDDFVESSPLGVDVTSVVHANSTSTSDNERAIVEPLIFLTTKNGVSFVMMAVIIG